jgi:PAS domain S-box-containing protein
MEGQLAAPFHFAVEFLILAVFAGAMFDALRSARETGGRVALVQAVGFASLVAAQVLHGTLVLSDGSLSLIALRSVGFGFIALSMRPMPASVALPAVFVAGRDASWAAIPATFALIAAARAFAMKRSEPRGAGIALSMSFVFFAAGEASLALSPPAGGPALIASHAARAAGALMLARWLWLSMVRSLRLRFVAVFVASLVLLASVVAGALTQVIGHNLEQEEFTRLTQAANGQKSALGERVNQAIAFAKIYGESALVGQAFKTGIRDLTPIAQALLTVGVPLDLDFVAFYKVDGGIVASARPDPANKDRFLPLDPLQGIALGGSESIANVRLRRGVAGEITSSGARSIAAVGAASVTDPAKRSRILGAIIIGSDIDREQLLRLRVGAEADITIIKGGEVISTSYDDPRAAAGLVSGAHRDAVRRTVEEQGATLKATARPGGDQAFVVYTPLMTENEAQIAGVIALSRPAGLLASSQRAINSALFLITLAASAAAAAFGWLLSGRVTRPIRALTNAARRIRGGDLEARATVELPDEVGALGEAFNDMATSLGKMTGDLRGAATEEANLRARMEAIMQSMSDALIATAADGTVVAVNRATESMLGRADDDLVGRKLDEVLTGTHSDGRSLADVALGGNGAYMQSTIESNGVRVPVVLTGAPLLDASGAAVGRVIVLRDVTREQEAERMKSEFLSNVSHELRTPLTPIKGYTEILRRKKFPREKTEQFLDGIAQSTKRLERIVEILVDFAALEAGRLKPRAEPIDVRAFLAGVLDGWRGRTGRHRVVRKIPMGLPPILGDERLLHKCLDELIDNAIKFSPEGGVIEIAAEAVAVNGRRRGPGAVRISVKDEGIGIDASQMGRLFQDFRQLDGSETRSFGGLGLGLSYARRLAVAHSGDITAVSEAGRGSTFTVVIPAEHFAKATRPKSASPPSSTRIRRTRPVTSARTAAGRKKVAAARAPAKTARKKPAKSAGKKPAKSAGKKPAKSRGRKPAKSPSRKPAKSPSRKPAKPARGKKKR